MIREQKSENTIDLDLIQELIYTRHYRTYGSLSAFLRYGDLVKKSYFSTPPMFYPKSEDAPFAPKLCQEKAKILG